jgi:DNA-binding NtrC family response regulator
LCGVTEHLNRKRTLGYEKGAFTDAKARKEGYLSTEAGTLFLDEMANSN